MSDLLRGASLLRRGRSLEEEVDVHAHDSSHATVFTMGTHVWVFFVCLLLIACVVFTILIEKLLHFLHHVPESYKPVVHKVQEEFMIMGVISFLVVIVMAISPISHDVFLNFEVAHLLLFFSAVVLAAYGTSNLLALRRCKRQWNELERE